MSSGVEEIGTDGPELAEEQARLSIVGSSTLRSLVAIEDPSRQGDTTSPGARDTDSIGICSRSKATKIHT
jgi:hypothetical protein